MATKFNREAFVASPFMRALTATDVLSDADKRAAEKERRRIEEKETWRAMNEYRLAFYEACAAHMRAHLAVRDTPSWKGADDPRTADAYVASDAAFDRLFERMDYWASLPKPKKLHTHPLLRALKEPHDAIRGPDQWQRWDAARERWLSANKA